jgi:hypothetical protein
MGSGTVLWAGKRLSDEEELRVRRLVSLLERAGDPQAADRFARFLPERADRWNPDDLEAGAHHGPWLSFGASVETSG